jgi:hypothetical protein
MLLKQLIESSTRSATELPGSLAHANDPSPLRGISSMTELASRGNLGRVADLTVEPHGEDARDGARE